MLLLLHFFLIVSQSEQGTLSCHESILSMSALCSIHTSRGMTTLTTSGAKYRQSSACFVKRTRSFRVSRESYLTLKNAMKLPVFLPANRRRISGRRLSPSEKFFGGREATTGNTSAVRRLPAFDCCAVVWYSCSKADREHLDKPHRRAASIIEGYTV